MRRDQAPGIAGRMLALTLPLVLGVVLCGGAAPSGRMEGWEGFARVGLLLLALPAAVCSSAALALVLWLLAPAPLTATCRAIERGRGPCFLTGAPAAVGGFLLASALGRAGGAGGTLAAFVLGLLALGGLTGLVAIAALLGQAALDLAGRAGSRAVAVMLGTVLLVLACLVPFVGWVLGGYFLFVGLGGAIRALVRPRKRGQGDR